MAGAGLVGCLQGIMLRQTGNAVSIYEKRPDPRSAGHRGGRSINLVVTSRGIAALKKAGLWSKVRNICVPVSGRMIHPLKGESIYQPYGRDASECNYSVSRGELNNLLLNEADDAGADVFFEKELEDYDLEHLALQTKRRNISHRTLQTPVRCGWGSLRRPQSTAPARHWRRGIHRPPVFRLQRISDAGEHHEHTRLAHLAPGKPYAHGPSQSGRLLHHDPLPAFERKFRQF